jgi:secreted trypsin-like serine protease
MEPTCGAPKAMASALTRIIGGRPSKKGQWPWQVAILNRNKVKLAKVRLKLNC